MKGITRAVTTQIQTLVSATAGALITGVLLMAPAHAEDARDKRFNHIDFFPDDVSPLQQAAGTALYKALDNPGKATRNLATGLIHQAAESIGMGDSVKEAYRFVKDKTEYRWGECSTMKLRSAMVLSSCLSDDSSIELESQYDLNEIKINFRWEF